MLTSNTIIDNRYQIREKLGAGGMGVVYLAEDQEKHLQVALKIVTLAGGNTNTSKRRTLREFRIMSQLEHPYVISVFQSGIHNQMPYIVMPYLSGGTLSTSYSEGTQNIADLVPRLTRAIEVAQALQYIHRKNIIHRDLKPENIMLELDQKGKEHALLMDFGLAKRQTQESVLVTLNSEKNQFAGSIHYASPEQIASRELDTRSDLYSLGCVLYWITTGEPPFTGNIVAILGGHMHRYPQPPSEQLSFLPNSLDEIILTLLEKDPVKRYRDAAEVGHHLQEVVEILTPSSIKPLQSLETSLSVLENVGTPTRLFVPPFIGRLEQWRVCKLALEELNDLKSNLIMLQGTFGLGLSRFLTEIEHVVNSTEFVLLKFNNHQGNHLPYQPWQSVLKNLYKNKQEAFNQAAKGLESALAHLIPEFSRLID